MPRLWRCWPFRLPECLSSGSRSARALVARTMLHPGERGCASSTTSRPDGTAKSPTSCSFRPLPNESLSLEPAGGRVIVVGDVNSPRHTKGHTRRFPDGRIIDERQEDRRSMWLMAAGAILHARTLMDRVHPSRPSRWRVWTNCDTSRGRLRVRLSAATARVQTTSGDLAFLGYLRGRALSRRCRLGCRCDLAGRPPDWRRASR